MANTVVATNPSRDDEIDGFLDDRVGVDDRKIVADQPRKTVITISGAEIQTITTKEVSDYDPIVADSEYNTPRLARGIIDGTISDAHKKALVKVPLADGSSVTEPATKYAAKYPFNRVDESDSGHYTEVDDTPGAERLKEVHRSGTFREVHPDGTVVVKVVKDNFAVIIGENTLSVQGKCNITVHGDVNLLCKKDMTQLVEGDMDLTIDKDSTSDISGDVTDSVGGDATKDVTGDETDSVGGDLSQDVTGDITATVAGEYKLTVAGAVSVIAGGNVLIKGASIHISD